MATAGVAAADISLSGLAEMGLIGGDTITNTTGVVANRSAQFLTDIDVTFTMSGETDNGLSFGASIDLDESDSTTTTTAGSPAFANTTQGGETIFISGAFGRLTMGDTDGAFDFAMREIPTGSATIDDVEEGAGYNGNGGLDGIYDGQILSYTYSVAGFGIALSAEIDDAAGAAQDDPALGFGVTYAGEMNGIGYNVGFGYQQAETAAGIQDTVAGLSLGMTINDLTVGLNYSQQERDGVAQEISHFAIGASYRLDAWTFGASYGQYEDGVMGSAPTFSANHEASNFAVTAGYDLGGGASMVFGYNASDVTTAAGVKTDADQFSLGLRMAF